MLSTFRLDSKTQLLAHNGQMYTVAAVEKTDWKAVPAGSLVFIAKSKLGSSYYSQREGGVMIPVISDDVRAGRVTENGLAGQEALQVQHEDQAEPSKYSLKSIYRIYFPLSATPLPSL
ncbi:hypothetical protein E5K00_06040 [Hymenobacter aquaticus]|uniref:Uncharacterized protein n=1 Tax=Hymenobacter aquaticus TaxID=1867101 RepID=A0A4Z0Q4Z6_9BACT|nr:hypothetical protein [Hymenobacter aquaticus]TGE24765.1 hypothetical protein E5K00_06040 [Hymenobacter aquaticus]